MRMTEKRCWIWPKPTTVICLNLTENWQRWTFTLWTWRKTIEFDRKLKILKIMAQRRTFMVEYDWNPKFNINIRFSVIFNRQGSSLWKMLLKLLVKFTKWMFVVVRFRSYFSVKLTTLKVTICFFENFKISPFQRILFWGWSWEDSSWPILCASLPTNLRWQFLKIQVFALLSHNYFLLGFSSEKKIFSCNKTRGQI